jgi:hypothetical protein
MVKPKVFLPQTWVTPVDCGYSIMLYDIPATNTFNYLAFFQIFSLSEDLMKIIPEARRAH